MSCAKDTKDAYIQVSAEKNKDVNAELIYILTQAEENHFEASSSFNLRLHGNKRNDRNEMYRTRLNDEDVEILCLAFKGNSYITSLDLGYNSIGDSGGIIIGNCLEENRAIHSLILSYNDICAKGAGAIAKGIQMNETLKVLKLDGNKVGVYGGMAIAGALQVNEILEELDVNNTEQSTQSVIAFTTVLKSNNILRILDIGRPILHSQQDETTVHFSKMLEVNNGITDIHLSKHGIQNFGAERLVDHLLDNITLLVLNLSCNRISRDGMKCLAKYLKGNPPLQLLNLGYNRAEDDGAIYLSEALESYNISLLTLVLCSNSLSDKGLCALAKSLSTNNTLDQLYIWGNEMDTAASQAFLDLTTGDFPRLKPDNTDVCGYVVDGIPYLARVASPY